VCLGQSQLELEDQISLRVCGDMAAAPRRARAGPGPVPSRRTVSLPVVLTDPAQAGPDFEVPGIRVACDQRCELEGSRRGRRFAELRLQRRAAYNAGPGPGASGEIRNLNRDEQQTCRYVITSIHAMAAQEDTRLAVLSPSTAAADRSESTFLLAKVPVCLECQSRLQQPEAHGHGNPATRAVTAGTRPGVTPAAGS
jgi:hypothetical protein